MRLRSRLLMIVVMTFAILVATALPASAKDDKDDKDDKDAKVSLETKETAAIMAGDTAWVSLMWLSEGDAENVRVTLDRLPDGVTVDYPENTGDHSGPMDGYLLSDGELDSTAFRLTVPYGTKKFKVRATATFETNGKTKSKKADVKIPIVEHQGGDLEQVTAETSIAAGESAWVDLMYSGMAPRTEAFSLAAAEQTDLLLTYPGDRDATSLQNDDLLEDGESDVARILIATTDTPPGSYELKLTVSYEKGDDRETYEGTLAVEVTG